MNVTVRAVHALSHDALRLARGEEGEMSEATAADLESKGLVEVVKAKKAATEPAQKAAPEPANKMAPAAKNKARR